MNKTEDYNPSARLENEKSEEDQEEKEHTAHIKYLLEREENLEKESVYREKNLRDMIKVFFILGIIIGIIIGGIVF